MHSVEHKIEIAPDWLPEIVLTNCRGREKSVMRKPCNEKAGLTARLNHKRDTSASRNCPNQ